MRKLILTVLGKGFSAVGEILFVLVIGYCSGLDSVGKFAIFYSLLLGSTLLIRFGMDIALIKHCAIAKCSNEQKYLLLNSIKLALVRSLIFCSVLLCLILTTNNFEYILLVIIIPLQVVPFLIAGYFKSSDNPELTIVADAGINQVVAIPIYLLLWKMFEAEYSEIHIITASLALASLVVILISLIVLSCKINIFDNLATIRHVKNRKFLLFKKDSINFFTLSLSQLSQKVLIVLIAGTILSNHELGIFKYAERLSAILGFPLLIANTILPSRIVSMYHNNKITKLKMTLRASALYTSLAAILLTLFLVAIPWLLNGDALNKFMEAYYLVFLLCLGQLLNIATGSVIITLNMTNNEVKARNIALLCCLISLAFVYPSVYIFGHIGLASIVASSVILQNLLASYAINKHLGFYIYPNFYSRARMERS